MPTIEIASINSTGLNLKQADFAVAFIEENELISHRGLFYDYLKRYKGVIVHIGNPDFKEDKRGGFFSGQIIDWSFESESILQDSYPHESVDPERAKVQVKFKFMEPYKSEMEKLIARALDHSPVHKAFFLTDYQFGPQKENIEVIASSKDFWSLHDTEGLAFNTLYEINGL